MRLLHVPCALALVLTALPSCATAPRRLVLERPRAEHTDTQQWSAAKQPSAGHPEPAPTCREDGLPGALNTLQGVARAPRVAVDRATLPTVSEGATFPGWGMESCPVLTVTADTVLWDGAPVAGADDAARARRITAQWRAARGGRQHPTTLCVAAPAQLPLARLDALVGRLDGVVLLAVAARRPATSPWAVQTLRTIDSAPAADRCRVYGDALERAAGSCEPARAALRALVATTPACAATPSDGAGVDESSAVTDALAACHCGGADITAIIQIYERAADRTTHVLRRFPLREDLEPGAGLEGALDGTATAAPTTVLDRVRALERQHEPRRD